MTNTVYSQYSNQQDDTYQKDEVNANPLLNDVFNSGFEILADPLDISFIDNDSFYVTTDISNLRIVPLLNELSAIRSYPINELTFIVNFDRETLTIESIHFTYEGEMNDSNQFFTLEIFYYGYGFTQINARESDLINFEPNPEKLAELLNYQNDLFLLPQAIDVHAQTSTENYGTDSLFEYYYDPNPTIVSITKLNNSGSVYIESNLENGEYGYIFDDDNYIKTIFDPSYFTFNIKSLLYLQEDVEIDYQEGYYGKIYYVSQSIETILESYPEFIEMLELYFDREIPITSQLNQANAVFTYTVIDEKIEDISIDFSDLYSVYLGDSIERTWIHLSFYQSTTFDYSGYADNPIIDDYPGFYHPDITPTIEFDTPTIIHTDNSSDREVLTFTLTETTTIEFRSQVDFYLHKVNDNDFTPIYNKTYTKTLEEGSYYIMTDPGPNNWDYVINVDIETN